MCLLLKSSKTRFRIALKPIVCYKYLIQTETGYITPYYYANIEIGKKYESKLTKDGNRIETGLHSFALKYALDQYVPSSGISDHLQINNPYFHDCFVRINPIASIKRYFKVQCIIPRWLYRGVWYKR